MIARVSWPANHLYWKNVGWWLGLLVIAVRAAADLGPLDVPAMSVSGRLAAALAPYIRTVEDAGIEVGVLFEDFEGDRLFAHQAERPYVLASNTKLFTTAAALLSLPADFRWSTCARLDDRTLWVVGAGDATFHIHEGYSFPDKFLDETAKVLRTAGVRRIAELVVDGRYFDDEYQHPQWPQDQLREIYASSVAGLPYNHGMIQMRRGRRTFYASTFSPLQSAATFLRHGLTARGIKVSDTRVATGDEPAPGPTATIYKQDSGFSLAEMLRETNANSDNYYAEHLLKTLGAEFEDSGSFPGGIRAVRRALSFLDVPLTGYTQLDGSGLARSEDSGNVATPTTVVGLLRTMAQHPRGEVFVTSLAVGGVSGTIEHRFEEPPLMGRVYAKTGRIDGSITLSGYLARDRVPIVAFSLLANHEAEGTFALRRKVFEFQDAVLIAVWMYLGESDVHWASPPTLVRALSAPRDDLTALK